MIFLVENQLYDWHGHDMPTKKSLQVLVIAIYIFIVAGIILYVRDYVLIMIYSLFSGDAG